MKFDVSTPWADDEHTSLDGPYVRLLKARKWLYLTTAAATLHHFRLLHYPALNKLSGGLLEVPDWMAGNTLKVALGVLVVQYALLLLQLSAAYRVLIRARLFKASAAGLEQAAGAVASHVGTKNNIGQLLADLLERVRLIRADRDIIAQKLIPQVGGDDASFRHYRLREEWEAQKSPTDLELIEANNVARLLSAKDAELVEVQDLANQKQLELANAEVGERQARASHQDLLNNTPEMKYRYQAAEYAIDMSRVGIPMIVASSTLWIAIALPR